MLSNDVIENVLTFCTLAIFKKVHFLTPSIILGIVIKKRVREKEKLAVR